MVEGRQCRDMVWGEKQMRGPGDGREANVRERGERER